MTRRRPGRQVAPCRCGTLTGRRALFKRDARGPGARSHGAGICSVRSRHCSDRLRHRQRSLPVYAATRDNLRRQSRPKNCQCPISNKRPNRSMPGQHATRLIVCRGADEEKARPCGPGLPFIAGAQTKTGCILCKVELLSKNCASRQKARGRLRCWPRVSLHLHLPAS